MVEHVEKLILSKTRFEGDYSYLVRKTLTEKQMLSYINKNVNHAFCLDREYIIVCNEHSGIFRGALLFWGHKTEDNEKRSFGGYTSDIDKCERYTLKEIKDKGYNFPIYKQDMELQDFLKLDDVIIKYRDLIHIDGLKTMKIIYRP